MPVSTIRDREGNLLASTEYRVDSDTYDFRIDARMLQMMLHGDALLVTVDRQGQPTLERIPNYRLYRR